jgi:hypothetical protein
MNAKKYFDPKDYHQEEDSEASRSVIIESSQATIEGDKPQDGPRPSYLDKSYMYQQAEHSQADVSMMGDEMPGVALRPVKDKWTELGPLKLEEIIE